MSDTTTTMTYTVAGMTCDHCVRSVTESLSALAGVTGVTGVAVDLASGRVTVSGDGPVDDGSVREAVIEAGYEVVA